MKNNNEAYSKVTRRRFLPFLSGLFFPFIGRATTKTNPENSEPESYQTLLTKDGKIVKVKSKTINDSKVIDKEISNRSLLKWLKKPAN